MGRIGRWLLRILEMALLPLLERLDQVVGRTRDVGHTVEAWGAATTQGLERVVGQLARMEANGAMQAAAKDERLTELILGVRSQTEAMRAWEDALLGRVTTTAERAVAEMREASAQAVARAHVDGVLARLATPEELEIAERTVQLMREDGRLEKQRPELRGKLVNEDIIRQAPGLSYARADAIRALTYLKLKGTL